MSPHLVVSERVVEAAGEWLRDAILEEQALSGRCRLGLAGGKTPAQVFEWLAKNLPQSAYAGLFITWVDERLLPASGEGLAGLHPDTNARLAYDHWLKHVPYVPAQVLTLVDDTFEAAFVAQFEARLDVTLLGVGEDGHLASLFPGQAALQRSVRGIESEPFIEREAIQNSMVIEDSPKPPPRRRTLTLPVLEDVAHTLLLATGAAKRAPLKAALANAPGLPISLFSPRGRYVWLVDGDANPLSE